MTEEKKTARPVVQGKTYILEIGGLGHSGEGVGRFDGFTVFVPGALPGEQVEVRVTEVKKNYAKGKLLNRLTTSPERTEPPCSIYKACGGCQLQHLRYEYQLQIKEQTVKDAVTRIGKLADVVVHPVLAANTPWHYRNKMQFPVQKQGRSVAIGCYAAGTHGVVDVEDCLIQGDRNNQAARILRQVMENTGVPAYDEKTGSGVIRHVMGRLSEATGEVMVVLVTATRELPYKEAFVTAFREGIPGLVGVLQNINSQKTNVVLGRTTQLLWGKETIQAKLGEFTFRISPQSFFQVNVPQAEKLYDKAVEYAGLTGTETVIDAYCGTGTITLCISRKARKVYGVEIVADAIRDAKENAKNNGVDNTEFVAADALDWMPAMYAKGLRPDVIVVDPPRAGCDAKVLEAFAAMEPRRIVYVSCNPSSLVRDLGILEELGYKTREIQPVDMFPMTHHVECVALVEKIEKI